MKRHKAIWTPDTDNRLRYLTDQKMDRSSIAENMGLTLWQVRGRAKILGVAKLGTDAQIKARQTMRPFSAEEILAITELATTGHTTKQIAKELGRSGSTILTTLYSLNLKTPKFKNPKQHWTSLEDEKLASLYLNGLSSHTIAKSMAAKSVAAVQRRIKKRRTEGTLPPTLHEWVSNRHPEIFEEYAKHANSLHKPLNM